MGKLNRAKRTRQFRLLELDRDRRAAPRLARDADLSAVLLDDLLGDRQAQPGAGVLGREIRSNTCCVSLLMPGPVSRTAIVRRSPAADRHRHLALLADGLVGDDVAKGRLELGLVAAGPEFRPPRPRR